MDNRHLLDPGPTFLSELYPQDCRTIETATVRSLEPFEWSFGRIETDGTIDGGERANRSSHEGTDAEYDVSEETIRIPETYVCVRLIAVFHHEIENISL